MRADPEPAQFPVICGHSVLRLAWCELRRLRQADRQMVALAPGNQSEREISTHEPDLWMRWVPFC